MSRMMVFNDIPMDNEFWPILTKRWKTLLGSKRQFKTCRVILDSTSTRGRSLILLIPALNKDSSRPVLGWIALPFLSMD
jgi:hypothetical protein